MLATTITELRRGGYDYDGDTAPSAILGGREEVFDSSRAYLTSRAVDIARFIDGDPSLPECRIRYREFSNIAGKSYIDAYEYLAHKLLSTHDIARCVRELRDSANLLLTILVRTVCIKSACMFSVEYSSEIMPPLGDYIYARSDILYEYVARIIRFLTSISVNGKLIISLSGELARPPHLELPADKLIPFARTDTVAGYVDALKKITDAESEIALSLEKIEHWLAGCVEYIRATVAQIRALSLSYNRESQ